MFGFIELWKIFLFFLKNTIRSLNILSIKKHLTNIKIRSLNSSEELKRKAQRTRPCTTPLHLWVKKLKITFK